MAQGCHLIFSADDRDDFRLSIPPQEEERVREAVLRDLGLEPTRTLPVVSVKDGQIVVNELEAAEAGLQPQADCFLARVASLSPEERTVIGTVLSSYPRARVDVIAGLGNTALSETMAAALPGALDAILRHTFRAPGLFAGVREGESSWISNLKNTSPGKADGIAYEVLATATLLGRWATNKTGATLKIHSTDSLAFGAKQQGWYGRPGPIAVQDGPRRSVFYQPSRKSVEADLLIRRPHAFSYEEIGIDFKHSQDGRPSDVPDSEIEGAWTALRTGELAEFHFVSNTKFSTRTRDKVGEVNRQIGSQNREGGQQCTPIELFEDFDWR